MNRMHSKILRSNRPKTNSFNQLKRNGPTNRRSAQSPRDASQTHDTAIVHSPSVVQHSAVLASASLLSPVGLCSFVGRVVGRLLVDRLIERLCVGWSSNAISCVFVCLANSPLDRSFPGSLSIVCVWIFVSNCKLFVALFIVQASAHEQTPSEALPMDWVLYEGCRRAVLSLNVRLCCVLC